MVQNVGQLERRRRENSHNLTAYATVGKRKDETKSCEKCRHLEKAHMYPMAEYLREKRLRWFGHVQMRDQDEASRKILQMTVDGKRNRGRPKLRWRDLVKEDMTRNQMTTEIAEDRRHCHA